MYKRNVEFKVTEALSDTPVVVIVGPRQCGKTTLAKQIVERHTSPDWLYVTLDDKAQADFANDDPIGFVRNLAARHVVIDEIQRAPELFLAIKQSIDEDRRSGRFLLTGSANAMMLPKLSDSLAGRIEVITLLPLSYCETVGASPTFFKAVLAGLPPQAEQTRIRSLLIDDILHGGFPEPRERSSAARRNAWFNQYIDTITKKDLKDLGQIEYLHEMPRLIQAMSQQVANLTNYTELAGEIGITRPTAIKYLSLLKILFIFDELPAWHKNEAKRLVKTPKMHMVDTGLLCSLKKITQDKIKKNPQLLGPLLENYVVCELRRQATWLEEALYFYHYRDKDKIEVDVVIENVIGDVIGIEVKASATVKKQDAKGLERLRMNAKNKFLIGILLYDGDHQIKFDENIYAIPIGALWS